MRQKRRSKKLLENYVCHKCFRQINKCVCEYYPPADLIWIDINMQDMIVKLNDKGYKTWSCCESHIGKDRQPNMYISFAWKYDQIDIDNLPDGFKWDKKDYAIVFTLPQKCDEEQAEKIKFEKLKLLSEWVESLPPGATPIYE